MAVVGRKGVVREGVRCDWSEVPAAVRGELDALLGSPVAGTTALRGGFSPGPAVRAELADGRVVFVKAAGVELNTDTPAMHRREAEVLASLPSWVPAPALVGAVDVDGWVAVAVEWIEGRAPDAARPADVERMFGLLRRVGADPSVEGPVVGGATVPGAADGGPAVLRPVAEVHADLFGHWELLSSTGAASLDDWSRRHLGRLAELDGLAPGAVVGRHLCHVDVRTDNVVLAGAGPERDVLVDWPGACLGAGWLDVVTLLPALHLDGAPPPEEALAVSGLAQDADREAVDAFVVALAGYFTRSALLPAPPGLPTLRPFQDAQGRIARRWAAERLRLA